MNEEAPASSSLEAAVKQHPKKSFDFSGTRHTVGPNAMGADIQNAEADAARKLPVSGALSRRTVRRPPRGYRLPVRPEDNDPFTLW